MQQPEYRTNGQASIPVGRPPQVPKGADEVFAWLNGLPAPDEGTQRPEYPDDALLTLRGVVDAVLTRVDHLAPVAVVAGAALGSVAAVVQGMYDIPWPHPDKRAPLSLYVFAMTDSGNRKSSVFDDFFDPHDQADAHLTSLYEKAKAKWGMLSADKRRKKTGGAEEEDGKVSTDLGNVREPTKSPPRLITRDGTYEAVLKLLENRPVLTVAHDDAAVFLLNWSGRMGAERAMQGFSALWSGQTASSDRTTDGGTHRFIHNGRYTSVLLSQPSIGLKYIMSEKAQSGMSARALLSLDPELADPRYSTQEQQAKAYSVVASFQEWVLGRRDELDAGAEYREASRAKGMVGLSDEDLFLLKRTFFEVARRRAKACRRAEMKHADSFWKRAHEHAARLAGLLTVHADDGVWPQVGAPPGKVIGREAVDSGIRLVAWYGVELERIERQSGDSALAEAMRRGLDVMDDPSKFPSLWRGEGFMLNRFYTTYYRPTRDPVFRGRVTDRLEREGEIMNVGRGIWKRIQVGEADGGVSIGADVDETLVLT